MVVLWIVFGLLVGSFLNVVVLRTKSGKNFAKGRSECPECHKTLQWYELIPVLSYVLQRGKCRVCRHAISLQYPVVEITTGLLFGLLYTTIGLHTPLAIFSLACWTIVASLLIASAVYDWRWMLLPDAFTLPAIVVAAIYVFGLSIGFDQHILLGRVLAVLVFGGFFALLNIVSNGSWLGDGDIRLAVIMGLMLSLPQLAVAILFSFNIAAIVSLGLITLKRKTRNDIIPLGPFLILGTFIGLFAGTWLANTYVGLFG